MKPTARLIGVAGVGVLHVNYSRYDFSRLWERVILVRVREHHSIPGVCFLVALAVDTPCDIPVPIPPNARGSELRVSSVL